MVSSRFYRLLHSPWLYSIETTKLVRIPYLSSCFWTNAQVQVFSAEDFEGYLENDLQNLGTWVWVIGYMQLCMQISAITYPIDGFKIRYE